MSDRATQAREALRLASERRLRRSELKRRLKRGEAPLAEALEDPAMATMPLFELLSYVRSRRPRENSAERTPRRAPWTARRIARRAGFFDDLAAAREVGKLTDRQRELVLQAASEYTP